MRKLPPELIDRIHAYRNIIDVDPGTEEEVIAEFERDLDPENLIEIWEWIAREDETALQKSPSQSVHERKTFLPASCELVCQPTQLECTN